MRSTWSGSARSSPRLTVLSTIRATGPLRVATLAATLVPPMSMAAKYSACMIPPSAGRALPALHPVARTRRCQTRTQFMQQQRHLPDVVQEEWSRGIGRGLHPYRQHLPLRDAECVFIGDVVPSEE